jgi:hypothetical protein
MQFVLFQTVCRDKINQHANQHEIAAAFEQITLQLLRQRHRSTGLGKLSQ